MDYTYSAEQIGLSAAASAFMARHVPITVVRRMMDSPEGITSSLWRQLGADGFLGILIPESYGGGGGKLVDFAAFSEVAGAALLPGPWIETAVVATALDELGHTDSAKEWLPRLASGESAASLALGDAFIWSLNSTLSASPKRHGYELKGPTGLIPFGGFADVFLAAAIMDGEPALFLVRNGGDVAFENTASVDGRERLSTADLDMEVDRKCCIARGSQALEMTVRMHDVATGLRCAEILGAAREVLGRGVRYANNRVQFGQPIGSYGAIQQMLADEAMSVENIAAATYWALWHLQEHKPQPMAVSVAKSYASEAYVSCCRAVCQVHGAMGFTWESDVHLFIKHAIRCACTYGSADQHRERLASLLLGGKPEVGLQPFQSTD
jgi:alkylation response protein AidB-like acyl-CoA dehydrogenase